MTTWPAIAALCAACAGVGASIDRMLLRSSKRALYDWLTGAWYRLGQTRVADLPGAAAAITLRPLSRWSFRRRRLPALGTAAVLSVLLTAASGILGRVVRHWVFPWYDAASLPPGTPVFRVIESHTFWLAMQFTAEAPALLVNFVFDSATVAITWWLLRVVRESPRVLARVAIILVNIAAAFVLAVGSVTVSYWIVEPGSSPYLLCRRSFRLIVDALTFSMSRDDAPHIAGAFFGMSTLLPISVYLAVLLGLVIAKPVLESVRAAAVYWLELVAEPLPTEVDTKFMPFTLLSLVVGAFGVVAKLVVDLAALAAHVRP